MRQVLPTKPLASATRYGPFFAGHWKYLVESDHGLKQAGFSPGPLTTAGGAASARSAAHKAATATVMRVSAGMRVSSLLWIDPSRWRGPLPRRCGRRDVLNATPRREGVVPGADASRVRYFVQSASMRSYSPPALLRCSQVSTHC